MKSFRKLCQLLAAILLTTVASAQVVNGDLNHNGRLDVDDVTRLIDGYVSDSPEYIDGGAYFNGATNMRHRLRVLSIGNSKSEDTFFYVPQLMQSVCEDVDLTIGIAYYSSASLKTHSELLAKDTTAYVYYKSQPGKVWNWEQNVSLKRIIQDEDWDIVLLQETMMKQNDYATYQPYLNDILDYVQQYAVHGVRLGWMMTPALANCLLERAGMTLSSDEYFEGVVACCQRVLAETPVGFVVPVGTAVQNARHNEELGQLGDEGELTFDQVHAQEGVPRMIEAYTMVITLLQEMNIPKSIWGNQKIVSEEWLNNGGIVAAKWMRKGNIVGTKENYSEAQRCAIMATKFPFNISE